VLAVAFWVDEQVRGFFGDTTVVTFIPEPLLRFLLITPPSVITPTGSSTGLMVTKDSVSSPIVEGMPNATSPESCSVGVSAVTDMVGTAEGMVGGPDVKDGGWVTIEFIGGGADVKDSSWFTTEPSGGGAGMTEG
jgi:hypothetical protein